MFFVSLEFRLKNIRHGATYESCTGYILTGFCMDEVVSEVMVGIVESVQVIVLSGDVSDLPDEVLLSRCAYYGEEARKWRNKFLGLLPEVARRRLYEMKGFGSIFHFAFVVGGVSGKQVERVLRLHERFQSMPTLQGLLESGSVSSHLLERVASIAEPKNEAFLADQVQMLSKKALDTLVKDEKRAGYNLLDVQKNEPSHQFILSEDVERELADLQERGVDMNQELREFLARRKQYVHDEKERLGELAGQDGLAKRYVPVGVRKSIQREYGNRCSIPSCNKPSREIHHLQRFGYVRRHDPRLMAPLCREHHQIAHSIDVKVQEVKKSRPP